MAKVRNAYTTYQAKGNREDLSDRIYNIDPFDTPVMNSMGRRTVSNRTFDWQTEKLMPPNGDNARQEGFELDRSPSAPTVRLSNICQISEKDATVSGSQEAANAAGRPSEMGAQMANRSKELKVDMEIIACSAQPMNKGDDAADPQPRRTRGIIHWLRTNVFVPTSNGAPVVALPANETAAYPAVPAANRVEFTEGVLQTMLQAGWQKGSRPKLLVMGPVLKATMSTFKGRESTQVLVGRTEVSATVDVYASDWGRVKALPSRWIDPNVVLGLDPAYMAMAYYRTLRSVPIAKIGDAETRMILAEWGIEMKNEAAHVALIGAKGNPQVMVDNIAVAA
jgi:hypothetical protein